MKKAMVVLLAITMAFTSTAWGADSAPTPNFAASIKPYSPGAVFESNPDAGNSAVRKMDPFPDPSSCPRFQKELQFLKNEFDQGQAQGRVWQNVAYRHTERGNRWQAIAGDSFKQPLVQAGAVAGVAILGVRTFGAMVSKPVLIVGLVIAGAAAYLFWHRAIDYGQKLEQMRKEEIRHINYFDLVKANQNYERDFIWPEQVERFKRLIQLNNNDMGLPTYKGGYQAFPVQDLSTVLDQQFSYFNLQVQLFYKAYKQLQDMPKETNWYVRMTTERHANLVKAQMADSIYRTYAYQAQLSYATGLALAQTCANASLTDTPARP